MYQGIYEIYSNAPLSRDVYRMELSGETGAISRPGQFINIALAGRYLRRPISICDYDPEQGRITIIYKVVGQGTRQMSVMSPGQRLDVLVGLGNGFDISRSGEKPLLIGGGVGVPPLYRLAKELLAAGRSVQAALGFRNGQEAFYEQEFRDLGAEVTLVTEDGSLGRPGRVTDWLPEDYSYYYACGPVPMLKALYEKCPTSGELSFEQRMGCGFGACLGCSCQTKYGDKRICKDGPVLQKEEIIW